MHRKTNVYLCKNLSGILFLRNHDERNAKGICAMHEMLFLRGKYPIQQAIEPAIVNFCGQVVRLDTEEILELPYDIDRRKQQGIIIGELDDAITCCLGFFTEFAFVVAAFVHADNVIIAPETHQCGNGGDKIAVWLQMVAQHTEGSVVILDVLENIESEDALECLFEWEIVRQAARGNMRTYVLAAPSRCFFGNVEAVDIICCLLQVLHQETISASRVQDTIFAPWMAEVLPEREDDFPFCYEPPVNVLLQLDF